MAGIAHPLKRYPYLAFFVERDGVIEVWRVLRSARDIPAFLPAPDSLI